MFSQINPDLINPGTSASGEWIDLYKGASWYLRLAQTELEPSETDEICEVTVSIKSDEKCLPIMIRLSPANAYLPEEAMQILERRGWEVDPNTWHQPSGEDCSVAEVKELGDRLDAVPYEITWEEFSSWRYEQMGGPKVYDHQDAEIDADIFHRLTRWAMDGNVTDSSMNHRRVTYKLLVDAAGLEAAQTLLRESGINDFETRQIALEAVATHPVHGIDDAGFGAIVRYTGTYWTWEEQA